MDDRSPFDVLFDEAAAELGIEAAAQLFDDVLRAFKPIELAALASRWRTWARPKQLPPASKWRRWGFLTGRGFGKTIAISKEINDDVEKGDATLICVIAQDEQSAIDIQIKGPSGLIATAPPWNKPEWVASELQLIWPNGARAYVRTPEVPGKIRGLEYHMTWASELQSWPSASRDEAWSNVLLSTRLGNARVIWDSTPKKKHPVLKSLLAEAEYDPDSYVAVRGTTHENAKNLAEGYIEDLTRLYGGTSKGREELGGEMLEDADNATAKQEWIDVARRVRPDKLVRRVLGADVAVTSKAGSDLSGLILSGLGVDGQAYVLRNMSDRHKPHAWAKILLDVYDEEECDVILVETNKGGDLVVQNLRAAAEKRNRRIVELGLQEVPRRQLGVINVKPLFSRGAKEERAQPVATAYEAGRISHVLGADLASIEETLTTWEPGTTTAAGNRSPDDLDALTFTIVELLGLTVERKKRGDEMQAAQAAQKVLAGAGGAGRMLQSISSMLGGALGGSKI